MTSIDTPGEAAPGEAPLGFGETADADLVLRTRSGDKEAFGELWFRHYRSGIAVARSVSTGHDPDDLVQEAYTRIYQSILRGGGPTGSFRAYLFTSIRNTAAAWGRAGRETAFDLLDTVEDPASSDEATAAALDRGLTHSAFRSLPTRWQEVLWYTEIEQMKPSEIAPLLGMKATAVAQLAFRAREGLREAWIQAHLKSVADGSDCQWTIEHLGAHARANLSRRDQRKVDEHLAECARCTIVAAEAKEVSSRLALVLLPLVLGVTGASAYLATLQGGGVPAVALAAGQSALVPGAVSAGQATGTASATHASGASFAHSAAGSTSAGSTTGGSAMGGTAAGGTAAGGTAAGGTAVGGSSVAGGAAAGSGALAGTAAGGASAGAVAVGTAATVAGVGGITSSIGMLIGATAAAVAIVGSVATASVAAPELLTAPFAAIAAHADQTVEEATADAASVDESTGATDSATDTDTASDTVAGDTGGSGLPGGLPSIGGAGVTWDGTQPTVAISVTGEPGATVELLVNDGVESSVVLDAGGSGIVSALPTYGNVVSNATLQFRYGAGDAAGEALTVRLGDLADLEALKAGMKPVADAEEGGSTGDEGQTGGNGGTNNPGTGQGTSNGSTGNKGNGQGTNTGTAGTGHDTGGKGTGQGSSGAGSGNGGQGKSTTTPTPQIEGAGSLSGSGAADAGATPLTDAAGGTGTTTPGRSGDTRAAEEKASGAAIGKGKANQPEGAPSPRTIGVVIAGTDSAATGAVKPPA